VEAPSVSAPAVNDAAISEQDKLEGRMQALMASLEATNKNIEMAKQQCELFMGTPTHPIHGALEALEKERDLLSESLMATQQKLKEAMSEENAKANEARSNGGGFLKNLLGGRPGTGKTEQLSALEQAQVDMAIRNIR
jgi:hypothetical protein